MAKKLPEDFKDFLKLLNLYEVHYLLIGGYAVGYYGYPRATLDMDIWIEVDPVRMWGVPQMLMRPTER